MDGFLDVDLLAMMPCALKVPLEHKVSEYTVAHHKEDGTLFACRILSNAVMQDDVYGLLDAVADYHDLPEILIAPGYSRFFAPEFAEQFRHEGIFRSVFAGEMTGAYERYGLIDPRGLYDMVAFNPLVILVDRSAYPDLVAPQGFEDLLDPYYEGLLGVRGHDQSSFCEGILLTVLKSWGEPGLECLGRSVNCKLHPSEMVKRAGSSQPDNPAVYILPYSFAQIATSKRDVELIWPQEGAIVNPVMMLTRADASEAIKGLARFFVGPDTAESFERVGFHSMYASRRASLPEGADYNFIGWDFLEQNDVASLTQYANDIVESVYRQRIERGFVPAVCPKARP